VSTLGFNTGYVEDLYRQYLEDPNSVGESWREFFADFRPNESFVAAPRPVSVVTVPEETVVPEALPVATPAAVREGGDGAAPAGLPGVPVAEGSTFQALRGPAAKIVENMEASLHVPTATTVRTVPVKLMAENRTVINDHQRSVGGDKVSFTHIVAWAVVQGLKQFPAMNTTFRHHNGTLEQVIPPGVNLGLAIDQERKGKRSLVVPNIKAAETLNFAQFLGQYNDLIRRARDGKLDVPDFQDTTASITNPGMIGTTLSVPRLMQGQGVIVGVGSIGYPTEYYAFPPEVVHTLGIAQVMTLTSTYDHRVIQGAESGAFLGYVEALLRGEYSFYDDIFKSLSIPYQPYKFAPDTIPQVGSARRSEEEMWRKQAHVLQLIRAYRVRGHLQADVNPLGYEWTYHPELDPAHYGLTVWDLDREFITDGLGGKDVLTLREIMDVLRQTYTRKIGIEFMHIADTEEKTWLGERFESVRGAEPLSAPEKKRMVQKLNTAEAFEHFLHTKFVGHKRFSLEGAETVVPMLDMVLSHAADRKVQEAVLGMAHRGRLNILANIFNKPYEKIFSEFEGNVDVTTMQGSGDVKYHLGAVGVHESPAGSRITITMASNPSHLEAVNPVVEGMARARQDLLRQQHGGAEEANLDAVLPILLHGDAAFAGQGVVAETLNLSQLPGYRTGGTIHIVINNQIGFTTSPEDARSSTYATDVARMIQAPIFHVNGDDPEACVRIARIAFEYRQRFNKDVVIDMLCYRVRGHNEGDEPMYTSPVLYRKIESKRSVRKLYTELLLRRGDLTPEEAEQMLREFSALLQDAYDKTKALKTKDATKDFQRRRDEHMPSSPETGASAAHLEAVVHALQQFPEGFTVHPKLVKQFEQRASMYFQKGKIDWGFAEALAFGTLLLDGTTVRLSGQDSRRGTFSHRHAVVYDQQKGDEYIPLNHIRDGQARLLIYDSFLSEYAVCGFEYGYSVANPEALVLWEAQFGDFSNGAQIIYDQFMAAAEEKWGQTSCLVLLLPHGFEGQGPEHSSARLERFLQLCAENNLIVANFSTPANYFHALRRQVKQQARKPLVVMAPKSLLRHPMAVSHPDEFRQGTVREVIPATADPVMARRLVFCSGKVYYDLLALAEQHPAEAAQVAVARIEQLYPFPAAQMQAELERYRAVEAVLWVQEEPANMGAWTFLRPRLDDLLEAMYGDCTHRVQYAGRPASASPAVGSAAVHALEQADLCRRALGL
jgi:2-oxoglutarate dehydrogenase E1 component